MKGNPNGVEVYEVVIIDEGFHNSGPVRIIAMSALETISVVHEITEPWSEWSVRTDRLSKLPSVNTCIECNKIIELPLVTSFGTGGNEGKEIMCNYCWHIMQEEAAT